MFVFHRSSHASRPTAVALNPPHLNYPSSSSRKPVRRAWSNALRVAGSLGLAGMAPLGGGLAGVIPVVAAAQQVDSAPRLGLGASSAITVHVGAGQIKHASLGPEVGGAIDVGWLGARLVRLSVGVDYLALTIDRPDSLGVRERGDGYVLTAFADVNAMPLLSRRLSPYGGVGFGVDAVGTTISNEQVGSIYNTNVFDLHAQLGLLYRMTPRSRLSLEARATGARVVRRLGVRLGYAWFYNQLASGTLRR